MWKAMVVTHLRHCSEIGRDVEGNGGDPPEALLRNLPEGAGETTFFPKKISTSLQQTYL